ncbi:MAG: methyltransferase [Calditrichaceae bacterium]
METKKKLTHSPLKMDLVTEEFRINDQKVMIERVKNLDDLVDQVSDDLFNEDERLPYWAELWPSAIAISRFVAAHPDLIGDKSVLELGCGLGLSSLFIAMQDPASLLLTDYEQPALEMSLRNFKLNNMSLPETAILDWRQPELNRLFEVIIASDILYEKRFFHPLIRLFGKFLEPGGHIIIAEPNRNIAKDFFKLLRDAGYEYDEIRDSVRQGKQMIVVSIYRIQKRRTG